MAAKNESRFETAFTVSIEAREGVTTGISRRRPRAHDPGRDRPEVARRATSSSPATCSRSRPRPGGVLERTGQTEAARRPRAARRPHPGRRDLRDHERRRHDGARAATSSATAQRHGLKMITVADLIAYRRRARPAGRARRRHAACRPAFGDFEAVGYRSLVDDKHHVALVKGDVDGARRRARARALGVPDRRRVPLAALRLRRAARVGAGDDRGARAAACCSTSPRRGAGSGC